MEVGVYIQVGNTQVYTSTLTNRFESIEVLRNRANTYTGVSGPIILTSTVCYNRTLTSKIKNALLVEIFDIFSFDVFLSTIFFRRFPFQRFSFRHFPFLN